MTAHPTARWTARQMIEAFSADGTESRYLLRDRDSVYGRTFRQRVKNMGIREVLIAPRSPWQNPYCERLIGTLRRECLDHPIVRSAGHLRRIVARYLDDYHVSRQHRSLNANAPILRKVEPPSMGEVVSIPLVGG